MLDVLFDAIKDSLVIFPFLFAVYILMEMIENARNKEKIEKALSGKYAPFVASVTGIIPECGFSIMCAKLYDSGLITVGTLIAAFLATSDEGLIVLISNGTPLLSVGLIVLWKVIYASFIGVLLNLILTKFNEKHVCESEGSCLECGERHNGFLDKFIYHPFYHAAKIFLYILVVNFLFNTMFYLIGEKNIMDFMKTSKYYQPLIASLFGLIPNCASSIILASGYTAHVLSFSGLIAGLSANAGVGLLVLFKNKKKIKKTVIITVMLYVLGIGIGYLTMLG